MGEDAALKQRRAALKKANRIRSKRAKLKNDLKTGDAQLQTLLTKPPKYIETMKVSELLLATPKLGKNKVKRILIATRLSSTTKVNELSSRRREAILSVTRQY